MLASLRYMQRMVRSEDPQQLWAIIVEAMKAYGFDRLAYGLSRNDKSELSPDTQDLSFFTNIVDLNGTPMIDHQLLMRTPMYRWATKNRGACSWSHSARELAAGRLSPDEEAAYRTRMRFGVTAGYTISFNEPSERGIAVMSLAAPAGKTQDDIDALWAELGEEITLVCDVMHLKMRSLPIPTLRRELSPRQREALEWVAAGKTTQDIATIMGISPAMVEKHLKLVREALDVGTTAQAVAKAALLNRLFTQDESPPPKED